MWLAAGFVGLFWATPQEMMVTYIQYLAYPAVVVTVYILHTSFIKCDLTEIKLDADRSILLEVSVFSFLLDWLHICRPVLAHRWMDSHEISDPGVWAEDFSPLTGFTGDCSNWWSQHFRELCQPFRIGIFLRACGFQRPPRTSLCLTA